MTDDLPTPLALSIVIEQVKQRVVMDEIGKHYTCTAYHDTDADPMHMLISNTLHCALCLDQWPCQQTVDYAVWSHLTTLSSVRVARFLSNAGLERLMPNG